MPEYIELSVATPWGTVRNEVHFDQLVRRVRLEVVLHYNDSPSLAQKFTLFNGDEPMLLDVPIGLAGVSDGDTLKLKPMTEADA